MSTYPLRVKDDTKFGGKIISEKHHAEYILREKGEAHSDYINREGAQSDRNGQKVLRKSFSQRRRVTRIRVTDATRK